jgi:uncharacterized protein
MCVTLQLFLFRRLLEEELECVGIRLNKKPPKIYFKVQKSGGIKFNATCTLTKVDLKLIQLILHEYKIFNAEVVFREDCNAGILSVVDRLTAFNTFLAEILSRKYYLCLSADEFIDVIDGNRKYLPCLYVRTNFI